MPSPLMQVPDGTRPLDGEVARVALASVVAWIIPASVLQPLGPELAGQVPPFCSWDQETLKGQMFFLGLLKTIRQV